MFLILVKQMVEGEHIPKENKPEMDLKAGLSLLEHFRIFDGAVIGAIAKTEDGLDFD